MIKKTLDKTFIQGRIDDLSNFMEQEMALFICCAVANVPYRPDIEADTWEDYLDEIGETEIFRDGETDVNKVLHSLMNDEDRWVSEWGEGSEEQPYTEKDYRYMDELFRSYSVRSLSSGKYDAQTEFTLRSVCRQQLLADKCLSRGTKEDIDMYTKLTSTIQKALESEKLRAKDEQQEEVRLDDIESVLQRKYGVGIEITKEQVFEMFYDWQKTMHFPNTEDAVDQAIQLIINNTRLNSDQQPLDMPDRPRFDASMDGMFDSVPSVEEEEAYEYLGLERRKGRKKDNG